jgi:hypothetical protein
MIERNRFGCPMGKPKMKVDARSADAIIPRMEMTFSSVDFEMAMDIGS